MAKRPENRFADCNEVVHYLRPFAKQQPIEFDFRQVVRARRKAAAKRAVRKHQDSARKSKSAIIRSLTAAPQSFLDTVIRDETKLERKSQSQNDPPTASDG